MPAPESLNEQVTQATKEDRAEEGAGHQRYPQFGEFFVYPGPGQLNTEFQFRCLKHPNAQPVTGVENRGDGDGVADPDQSHGNRQIAAQHKGHKGGQNHLTGHRNKCAKQTHKEGNRYGMTIQVEEVGIIQQGA